jgi:hypothetical protein
MLCLMIPRGGYWRHTAAREPVSQVGGTEAADIGTEPRVTAPEPASQGGGAKADDRTKGCPDLLISHWVGELDVDDSKFPGDARNSRNHYTTALMVTNLSVHKLASPRRLALANATRT